MELKGFTRYAAGAAALGMLVSGGLVGAPLAAAQETATWTMPALREEVLQNAVDSVIAEAGEQNIKFNIYDRDMNQVVYNYTNWVVCGQSPSADSTVKIDPAKPRTVTLALSRRMSGC